MSTFAVTLNRPGYLPEADPVRTRDAQEAAAAWRAIVRETLDSLDTPEQDEEFLNWDTKLHIFSDEAVIAEAREQGSVSWVIDGYAHNLDIVPEEIIVALWVCDCCTQARENGETCDSCDVEPWSLHDYAPGEVTLWTTEADSAEEAEEGEGEITFSHAACDACGTPLAGHRTRYALWG